LEKLTNRSPRTRRATRFVGSRAKVDRRTLIYQIGAGLQLEAALLCAAVVLENAVFRISGEMAGGALTGCQHCLHH
jgi:hypothetical protein